MIIVTDKAPAIVLPPFYGGLDSLEVIRAEVSLQEAQRALARNPGVQVLTDYQDGSEPFYQPDPFWQIASGVQDPMTAEKLTELLGITLETVTNVPVARVYYDAYLVYAPTTPHREPEFTVISFARNSSQEVISGTRYGSLSLPWGSEDWSWTKELNNQLLQAASEMLRAIPPAHSRV